MRSVGSRQSPIGRAYEMRGLLVVLAFILVLATVLTLMAAQSSSWERDFGISVVNEEALTDANRLTLRMLLSVLPRPLYRSLQTIRIESLEQFRANHSPPGSMICWPPGNHIPQQLVFPTDTPGFVPLVDFFYFICAHELAHQIDASEHTTPSRPWLLQWRDALIAEAGCEPIHYLRSAGNVGPGDTEECYFVRFPQEFVARNMDLYWTDTRAMWRLAVRRFQDGNPHPINQAVLLTAWLGLGLIGDTNRDSAGALVATIPAFRYDRSLPVVSLWLVRPLRCGEVAMLVGPSLSLTVDLDAQCRVTAITHQEGL